MYGFQEDEIQPNILDNVRCYWEQVREHNENLIEHSEKLVGHIVNNKKKNQTIPNNPPPSLPPPLTPSRELRCHGVKKVQTS
jgi:hypothetical protein